MIDRSMYDYRGRFELALVSCDSWSGNSVLVMAAVFVLSYYIFCCCRWKCMLRVDKRIHFQVGVSYRRDERFISSRTPAWLNFDLLAGPLRSE